MLDILYLWMYKDETDINFLIPEDGEQEDFTAWSVPLNAMPVLPSSVRTFMSHMNMK